MGLIYWGATSERSWTTFTCCDPRFAAEGGICPTLNLSDTEVLRQSRVSLGWVLSDNFRVGRFPASRFAALLAARLAAHVAARLIRHALQYATQRVLRRANGL